jgi:hypothetical protein
VALYQADRSTRDPRGRIRGGGAPPGGAACWAGDLGAAESTGGAPGPRAYWRTSGDAPGLARGVAGAGTENAERDDIDNMLGIVNRIR